MKIPIFIVLFTLFIFSGCAEKKTEATIETSPSPQASVTPSPSPSQSDIKAAGKYRQLGLQYRRQSNYSKAIEALKKSVEFDPENLSGRVVLGWTLHLAGQEKAAAQALQQALNQDSTYVPALNALGIVYLVSGDLHEAVDTHLKAAKLKPDNEIAYYNLSLAYHRLKKYEQAIANGKKAATLESNNPHPWVALAMAYWDKGEKTQAKQAYNQAISLDPRYREGWFLNHLQEAGFSPEQIKLTKIISKHSAISRQPIEPSIHPSIHPSILGRMIRKDDSA